MAKTGKILGLLVSAIAIGAGATITVRYFTRKKLIENLAAITGKPESAFKGLKTKALKNIEANADTASKQGASQADIDALIAAAVAQALAEQAAKPDALPNAGGVADFNASSFADKLEESMAGFNLDNKKTIELIKIMLTMSQKQLHDVYTTFGTRTSSGLFGYGFTGNLREWMDDESALSGSASKAALFDKLDKLGLK